MTGLWLMELLPRRPRRRPVSLPPQQALHPPQPQFPLRPAATTSSTSSSGPTPSTSTTSTSGGGGGVPEFPYQVAIAAVFTVLLAASYLLVRRGSVRGGRAVQELPAAL